jgi:hypothetical protein
MGIAVPQSRIAWKRCWRIIPTRRPRTELFKRISRPDEYEALERLEELTNERVLIQRGVLQHLPRVSGHNAEIILSPFAHPNPSGSRFSDGSFGVLYAGRTIATAIAETRYHRELFLRATAEASMVLAMRAYVLSVTGRLHDLRGLEDQYAKVYAPNDYSASQRFGKELRAAGSLGIVYDSVRHPKSQCVAGFWPRIFSHCRADRELLYFWDGKSIAETLFVTDQL